jgi:hypothetical protein
MLSEQRVEEEENSTAPGPYLSVVVTARNDDHGGNLLGRMQIFVDAWIGQARRHGLECELILVEWNPTPDRPRLSAALRWPADPGPCRVRIIEVSPELHARYRHAAALPLYQMIAKNAGILRARGEFVLATNIDVVFSDETVAFFARKCLQKGKMYRMDRHDVDKGAPVNGSLDEQLEYCRTHPLRLCAREGTFKLTPDGLRLNPELDITSRDSGIWFGEGWHPVELYGPHKPFRWIDDRAQVIARVPNGGGFLSLEVEPGPGSPVQPQRLEARSESGELLAEWEVAGRDTIELMVPPARDGGLRRFRFCVPGAGMPVFHDPRALNMRVFRCDWVAFHPTSPTQPTRFSVLRDNRRLLTRLLGDRRRPGKSTHLGPNLVIARAMRLLRGAEPDVNAWDLECRFAKGCYGLEHSGGERFRWVDRELVLQCRVQSPYRSLELLLEPGPAVGFQPFQLEVFGPGDTLLCRIPVDGMSWVEIPLPAACGDLTSVHLRAVGGGRPTGSDKRNLTFRVFAVGHGSAAGPSAPVSPVELWEGHTACTRPIRFEWNPSEEDKKLITAMGRPVFLHLNACGDFTLMAREHWIALRGYAELDQFSMHLDSLLCYAAHHAGYREEMLRDPMRTYHIEHGVGSGWTPEGQQEMYARIARKGIPTVSPADLVQSITQMRILHAPVLFNRGAWGLSRLDLPESAPSGVDSGVEARG